MDDELIALRDTVRQVLARECPPDVVRAGWPGGPDGRVRNVWSRLAEVGVFGLLVRPESTGLGLDETYLVAVLEETGYAALPGPTVDTIAVAAPLLSDSPDVRDAILAGTLLLAVATSPAEPVPYGDIADAVLTLRRDGASLARIAERRPVSGVDGGRRLAIVVAGPARAVNADADELATARLRATLGTAAELIGLGRRMLDLTVPYVTQRRQFGAPVGSFQAVKHHLADALLAVEFAAPLVRRAARSLAGSTDDARRDVSMAKASASDAARLVARLTLQCHGAMAYTTEYDHHLFAKRAWALSAAWGGAATHRSIVAAELGLSMEGTAT